MLYILTIADRGVVSREQVFCNRQVAEEGLIRYLKENASYDGPDEINAVWRWLEKHDERLSVEIVEQQGNLGIGDSMTALRRIYDVLYLDLKKNREFYNEEKAWDADTTSAIADIVRPFFPKPPSQAAE
jgi:hypothetical protein